MNVKVKIDENQDFKNMIIKRIQQELHQILKTDFNNIVNIFTKNTILLYYNTIIVYFMNNTIFNQFPTIPLK